jgi:hypothetical protein
MNLDDSSMDKPWRLVTEKGKSLAVADAQDARRLAEAVGFVEQALVKATDLVRQGKTQVGLKGLEHVLVVLNHWSTEAYTLAETLGFVQDEDDAIDLATEE